MEKNTAQTVVKVYAVLAWLGALFAAIGGIALLAGGGSLAAFMPVTGNEVAPDVLGGFAIGAGIVLLALAVLYAIAGYGLWRHREWARITTIVLSVISLFNFPIGTIIGALGIWLFAFEPTVKSLFTTRQAA